MKRVFEISGFFLLALLYSFFVLMIDRSFGLFFGFIFGIFGIFFFVILFSNYLRSYISIVLNINPQKYSRGGNVPIIIQIKPRQSFKLHSLIASLYCNRIEYASGQRCSDIFESSRINSNSIPLSSEVLCEASAVIDEDVQIKNGELKTYEIKLPLSRDGLPTDDVGSLQVRWFAEVTAAIANFPDQKEKVEVLVGHEYAHEEVDNTMLVKDDSPKVDLPKETYDLPEKFSSPKSRFSSLEFDDN